MKKLLTALMILAVNSLFAQQEALFSQYMFNKLTINPGYAGSHDKFAADVVYRYQWVQMDGAPKTLTASLHTPFPKFPQHSMGLYISNDKIGPMNYTEALATYAYRIIFPKSKLSFGIQAGIKNNGILWDDFRAYDEDDPFLINKNQVDNKTIFDANFGIYYYTENFYAGLSSQQLLQNQSLLVTDSLGNTQFAKLSAHFFGMTGFAIPLGESLVFLPSFLLKSVKNATPQLDLNASLQITDAFLIGLSYRTVEALSVITEVKLSQNIFLGLSYDVWLNKLKTYNKGSYEIRLSYEINSGKRMLSPRYF